MIIIEGVDGTGKSNLVQRLAQTFSLPVHERASASRTGPVSDLWAWTMSDVSSWDVQPTAIYDRHPMVSEFIYGPVTRGTMDPNFFNTEMQQARDRFHEDSLVIFCDPGWEEVIRNLERDPHNQMPGVMDNSRRLYLLYKAFAFHYTGKMRVWDYRQQYHFDALCQAVGIHLDERATLNV